MLLCILFDIAKKIILTNGKMQNEVNIVKNRSKTPWSF